MKKIIMKDIELKTVIQVCKIEELSEEVRHLVGKAITATENSYSPYSKFRVGAAVRLEDGTEIMGANQENAAFAVTMCAERSAIFNAQSNHPELAICEIAIAACNVNGLTKEPVSPCGSCRQVLLEMEQRYKRNIKIYLCGKDEVYVVDSIKDLMPLSFIDDSMR